MFLCLYSGGTRKRNERIDLHVIDRVGKKGSLTYIPSASTNTNAASYFESFKRYYGYYGIKRFKYFCHDRLFRPVDVRNALDTDAIYLSGGNTFSFKHSLQRAKLEPALQRFVAKGGALLGQSAGSILMTPSLATSSIGPIVDDNEVGLKDLSGLGLIDISFVPHYAARREIVTRLRKFSASSKNRLLIAAEDGAGVIKSDGQVTILGPVTMFSGGEVLGTLNR